MPAHRLLAPRDFRRMPWKNGAGRTSEIASWPDGAGAFAGRVSIAEIERDGPFSAWPGVDRTFVLLDGAGVVLTQHGVDSEVSARHEPFRFAGDEAASCRLVAGPARAFNLMVRRGAVRGGVTVADGGSAFAGPFRFGVCYAAQGASECLLPGAAPGPSQLQHVAHGPTIRRRVARRRASRAVTRRGTRPEARRTGCEGVALRSWG